MKLKLTATKQLSPRHISKTILALSMAQLMTLSLLAPATSTWAATATKTGTTSSNFATNRQADVEIRFSKPNIAVEPAVELAIVVDTSRSMTDSIASLRTTLINFVNNDLSKYPGAVMVGLTKIGNGTASFDSNNSNNPGENFQMFHSGTSNPRPNSQTGIDKVVAITNANRSQLVSALNAIEIEPFGNPNSPDLANSYTSDLGPGLMRAAGMFTSSTTRLKRAIIMTDGDASKGYCPLNSSGNPASQIGWPSNAALQVVPGGSTSDLTRWLSTRTGTEDSSFPSSYPTTHGEPGVCKGFIHNFYSGPGLLADNYNPVRNPSLHPNYHTSFLNEMANRFPSGSVKSPNITTGTLTHVLNAAKISSIVVTDTLNSTVFNNLSSGSYLGLYRCGTNTSIGSVTFTPSGTGFTMTIPTATVEAWNGDFCLRLRTTIRSGVSSGSHSINTTSSSNQIRYRNSSGVTLATDTIEEGSINVPITYTAPTSLNHTNLQCTSVTLRWTAGVGGYPYTIQVRQGTTVIRSATASSASTTSVNITGLSGNNTYSWRIAPSGQSAVNAPNNFTTPHCLSYTVSTPGSFTIEPGAAAQPMNYDFNFTPSAVSNPTAWSGKNMYLRVINILPTSQSCPAFSTSNAARSNGSHSTTSNISVNRSTATLQPSSQQQVSISLTVGDSVPQGTYRICVQTWPSNNTNMTGTYQRVFSNTFTVQHASWLQVDGNSASIHTGEVHSNGSITMKIPYGQNFFKSGLSSIVGNSSGGINGLAVTSSRLSSIVSWRVAAYVPPISSPVYDDLLRQTTSKVGAPQVLNAAVVGNGQGHINSQCAQNASKTYLINGNLVKNDSHNITDGNCPNANLVYFINGNLTVNANMVNDASRTTTTYIVKGNITVASSVTRLDGVFLFGGSFRNGAGSQTLTTKGSLLGLAGLNPSSSSGRFYHNSQSGFLRDLGNGNNNPAETIIYQPKYLHRLAPILGGSTLTWQES